VIASWPVDVAALQGWRPKLKGDSDTHDIMAFYAAVIPALGDEPIVVEIGVAHGRSLLWAAAELLRTGRRGAQLYGVDPWRFTAGPAHGHSSMIFKHALMSLTQHGSDDELQLVRLLRLPSVHAAELFRAGSVDLVMIDGDHSERGCADDIAFWSDKVRTGGFLAGHDYSDRWPSVVAAVDSAFGGRATACGTVWVAPSSVNLTRD
jgi:predicted O-methyltransferase YrrM